MIQKTVFLLLGLVFIVNPAEARLGESQSQCEERYGPVVETRPATMKASDPEACVFSKSGVTAVVEFKGGIAWRVVFRMMGMTIQEAETLLRANMPEGGWGKALKFNGQDYRLSSDRQRIAVFTPTKSLTEVATLEIASRDYGKANHEEYSMRVSEALKHVKGRKTGEALKGF